MCYYEKLWSRVSHVCITRSLIPSRPMRIIEALSVEACDLRDIVMVLRVLSGVYR